MVLRKDLSVTSRPSCPTCGANGKNESGHFFVWSKGDGWRCTNCKSTWYKKPPQKEINNLDLERYVFEPRLTGDYLIMADTHVPFQHPLALKYAQKIAEKFNIRRTLIAGDFVELESFKPQKYPDKHEDLGKWEDEKDRVRKVLSWLIDKMQRVDLLIGNHELRMWKRLMGRGSQKDIYEIISADLKPSLQKKLHYYLYPVCVINDSWIIDHPNISSVIQTRVPERLSAKYMVQHLMELIKDGIQPPNNQLGYVSGHGHLGGEGTDVSGEIQIADSMVMCDPELFTYHIKKRTARPEWRIGFNILKNNYLYRFPLNNTDWKWWLK